MTRFTVTRLAQSALAMLLATATLPDALLHTGQESSVVVRMRGAQTSATGASADAAGASAPTAIREAAALVRSARRMGSRPSVGELPPT